MADAISAQRLTKVYRGGKGVFELDFRVAAGEIFGFLGPNGAGKTTTIRVILGLLRPSSGSLSVFGRDCWRESTAARAEIGFVPGDPRLYERMSGGHFLEFLAGFRAPGTLARARRLALQFDLDLKPRIRHLSRGNRQKLLLVQALMHDPPLLVLDEPTGGLDPLGQAAFLELLRDERSRGKTVFLSSHFLPEVERVADRVAVIRDGRLVAVEEVEKLAALRERKMELTLGRPLDGTFFSGLPGVRLLASHDDGRRVELLVRGSPQALLQRLAREEVLELVYPHADLESVFLHYYQPSPDGAS
ncbi:MAG TPA: ABC transporter ATP-binding protein [Candidatus Acidoferrales bacterium]|nr:ABC transporter ATP-binding protein [Candidatus Acidoferrales bacterium]